MQQQNNEKKWFKALDRFIIIVVTIALIVLVLAYFTLGQLIDEYPEILTFLQALITSLIPVPLLFILSYVVYRHIDAIRSEYNEDLFATKIAEQVFEKIENKSTTDNLQSQNHWQTLAESRGYITDLNKTWINMADENIISFSGDLSWIEDCQKELSSAADRNVKIQLLCKDPKTIKAKKVVKKYYNQPGIEIKYYPANLILSIRGMMIDISTNKKAVFFGKIHKSEGERFERGTGNQGNTENFDYPLMVFDKKENITIVAPFIQLFEVLWNRAAQADILKSKDNDDDETLLKQELKKIRQYTQSTISIQNDVKVANLKPLHRYIDESEYIRVQDLVERFKSHDAALWSIISIERKGIRKIISPPIIEKHNGEWIVVDGLARVYTARKLGLAEITACVIEKVSEPPVGQTWNWEQVRITKNADYKKDDNFRNRNSNYWRELNKVHASLSHIK